MICPTCYGVGAVPDPDGGWRPCPADGCHAGHAHCCDGDTMPEPTTWERVEIMRHRAREQYEHGLAVARRKAREADNGQG
jgi:hypothetical protein